MTSNRLTTGLLIFVLGCSGNGGDGGGGDDGGIGGDGGSGDDGGSDDSSPCESFCAQQSACSDFPVPVAECASHCEETRTWFVEDTAACRDAVDGAYACMAEQACPGWSDASLAGGACANAVTAQAQECNAGGMGFYNGWGACILTCRHAVTECEVEVRGVSTYLSYVNCWGECKGNKLYDDAFGCLVEGLRYDECELELPCDVLERHLNGDTTAAPTCVQLADEWAAACEG